MGEQAKCPAAPINSRELAGLVFGLPAEESDVERALAERDLIPLLDYLYRKGIDPRLCALIKGYVEGPFALFPDQLAVGPRGPSWPTPKDAIQNALDDLEIALFVAGNERPGNLKVGVHAASDAYGIKERQVRAIVRQVRASSIGNALYLRESPVRKAVNP